MPSYMGVGGGGIFFRHILFFNTYDHRRNLLSEAKGNKLLINIFYT